VVLEHVALGAASHVFHDSTHWRPESVVVTEMQRLTGEASSARRQQLAARMRASQRASTGAENRCIVTRPSPPGSCVRVSPPPNQPALRYQPALRIIRQRSVYPEELSPKHHGRRAVVFPTESLVGDSSVPSPNVSVGLTHHSRSSGFVAAAAAGAGLLLPPTSRREPPTGRH
jgi:hypothetical protein